MCAVAGLVARGRVRIIETERVFCKFIFVSFWQMALAKSSNAISVFQ
jgi:hypothetical protein